MLHCIQIGDGQSMVQIDILGGYKLPRYDYKCTSCSHEFELVQSFKEAGSGTCPECSSPAQRVFHAVPVIYKGSGFYTTDYGRTKAPVESSKETKSDSEDKGTSSSEKKPSTESSSSVKSDSGSKSTTPSTT